MDPKASIGWLKSKYILIYFIILFLILAILYSSSFDNPPRSDYWSAFYFFHLVNSPQSPPSWLHVLTYDPWAHGTFRPLSFFILYLEHLVFGSSFVWNHITNFVLYCLSILLLYRLSRQLSLSRLLSAAFLGVYTFLFSHFDIITWTFHLYSITGFSALLFGFSLYLSFLKSGDRRILFPAVFFFLIGMLCYEVFALWPLAIILLTYSDCLPEKRSFDKKSILRTWIAVLAATYLLYFGALLTTQAIGRYSVGPLIGVRTYPSILTVLVSVVLVFFNILYTGLLINVVPLLAVPALVSDNIDMGGFLANHLRSISELKVVVVIFGGLTLLFFLWLGLFLFKKKRSRTLHLLVFFFFLLFTFFFTTSLARSITNPIIYPLLQFRYQYIPNAMLALIAVALIDTLLRAARREKIIILIALLPILIGNIYVSSTYISILANRLGPLQVMLSNIKTGLKSGLIDGDNKLYIEEGITDTLPELCWNNDMAFFMKGTYQWVFSEDELDAFTFNEREAKWIIRENDYMTIARKDQVR